MSDIIFSSSWSMRANLWISIDKLDLIDHAIYVMSFISAVNTSLFFSQISIMVHSRLVSHISALRILSSTSTYSSFNLSLYH